MSAPATDDLARLDARIAALRAEYDRARGVALSAYAELQAALAARAALVAALQATSVPPVAPAPAPVGPTPAGPARVEAAPSGPPPGPETSTRTVQNVLFVLGGVLLGLAAIVFTAVAWATYGVTGRAVILGVATVLALTAPLVALARGLRATAETFAAIGLVLFVLDGYAIWYVNLASVRSMPADRYAGLVAAATALVALGYGRLTRLAGPGFVALIAAQPVAVLLIPLGRSAATLSLVASGTAAANALVARSSSNAGRRVLAWIAFCAWVPIAGATAVEAEATATTVAASLPAGAATIMLGLVLLLGAWFSGNRRMRTVAGGVVVLAVIAALLVTGALAWPDQLRLVFAAIAVAVAAAVRVAGPALPPWLRPGPRWAAFAAAGLGVLTLTPMALRAAASTVSGAYPFWSAPLSPTGPAAPYLTWSLPVAVAGLAVALVVVGPRWTYGPIAAGAVVLAALALPACVRLPWWTPPALSLAGAAVLALGYLAVRPRGQASPATQPTVRVGVAVLVGDALLTATARPALTAATLVGVTALGLAVAWLGRGEVLGGIALATGLAALPPALGSVLRALEVAPWWAIRGTVAVAALLVLSAVVLPRRSSPGPVAAAATVSAVLWPLVAMTVGNEPVSVYSGLSLLLLAMLLHDRNALVTGLAAVPAGGALVASVGLAVVEVTLYPYAWLASVWSGPPSGVGLRPDSSTTHASLADAVALGLLAVASAVAVYARTRRLSTAISGLGFGGPTAILVALVATQAPWPALPLATLVLGLCLVLPHAFTAAGGWRSIVLYGQGLVYTGAGVAGTLGVQWATLTSLGAVVVAFCVVAGAGRTVGWRVLGCLTAVVAAVLEASAAGAAAGQGSRTVALLILGVGILALFAGALLRRNTVRRLEATVTEAAATGAAVVAFALTANQPGWAAAISAVWGLAFGGRALIPGITPGVRRAYAAVGGGLEVLAWWLLLAARDVRWVEAYTVPLAAIAAFAGWSALRSRPELRSWVAYGPALLAGFLPTLAMVLASTGEVWRRLALFVAALAVVILGAVRRRRAPVVVGGIVLVAVGVHELALVWQLLPGWIPLAVGGVTLIFLAITYERRRRDVRRLRDVLNRMT